MTEALTSTVELATLPAIPCTAWCEDGDGHPHAVHPEDQWCSTDPGEIELSAEPLSTFTTEDGSRLSFKHTLAAYLSREAWSTRTLVNLTSNSGTAIVLTEPEAAQLINALAHLLLQSQVRSRAEGRGA